MLVPVLSESRPLPSESRRGKEGHGGVVGPVELQPEGVAQRRAILRLPHHLQLLHLPPPALPGGGGGGGVAAVERGRDGEGGLVEEDATAAGGGDADEDAVLWAAGAAPAVRVVLRRADSRSPPTAGISADSAQRSTHLHLVDATDHVPRRSVLPAEPGTRARQLGRLVTGRARTCLIRGSQVPGALTTPLNPAWAAAAATRQPDGYALALRYDIAVTRQARNFRLMRDVKGPGRPTEHRSTTKCVSPRLIR